MKLKLHVIGPQVGSSSYLITGPTTILLDCGSGTWQALRDRGCLGALDAIVLSHMHVDHILDVLTIALDHQTVGLFPGLDRRARTPLLIPREGGEETLHALAVALTSDYWGIVRDAFDLVPYDEGDRFDFRGVELTFARTVHNVACYAPRIATADSVFVYTADSAYCPELATHAAAADVLLCEATLPSDGGALLERHMNGFGAGRLAAEADVGQLVLTHLPPDPAVARQAVEDAQTIFGGPTLLAQTDLVIEATFLPAL